MSAFLDLFSQRQRRLPRVAVRWLAGVEGPGTESYASFYACEVSTGGVRLEGGTPASVRRSLSPEGRARMRLHMPHPRSPFLVEAELKWGLGDPLRTGWQFTRIDDETRQALKEYIDSHSSDSVQEDERR